jgi:hypothetical protein
VYVVVIINRRDAEISNLNEQLGDFKASISLEYMYLKVIEYKAHHGVYPKSINEADNNNMLGSLNFVERNKTVKIMDILTLNIFSSEKTMSNKLFYIHCDGDNFALLQKHIRHDWDKITNEYLAGRNGLVLSCYWRVNDEKTQQKCIEMQKATDSWNEQKEEWDIDTNKICNLVKRFTANPTDLGGYNSEHGSASRGEEQTIVKP